MDTCSLMFRFRVLILLLTTGRNSASAECWFEGSQFNFINLGEITENATIGEPLTTLNPTAGTNILSIRDLDTEYLQFRLDEGTGVVVVTLVKSLEDYLLQDCVDSDTCIFQTQLSVTCTDSSNTFTLHFNIEDINNQPPQFKNPSYASMITVCWPDFIPLNYNQSIQVVDYDFKEKNANLTFTVNNYKIALESKKLLGKPYTYEINLYLRNNQLTTDDWLLEITATDGLHMTIGILTLTYQPDK